jgi:hypothetical protein
MEKMFQGGSRGNVSAHLADEGSSKPLRKAVDEDSNTKEKDDCKEGQVMTVASKF